MLKSILAVLAGAAIGMSSLSAAYAAGEPLFDPQPAYMAAPAMTGPDLFSGAYAGVAVGLQVNHFGTFYGVGTNYRLPGGVFAGYNYALMPWLIAGVEAQFDATYDPWSNAFGSNAFALARLGVLTSPDFMVYQSAGFGLIDSVPAVALGMGIEQSVTDNFSLRFESQVYGQVRGNSRGRYMGGFTSMELALGALWYLDGNPARSGWHAGSRSEAPTDFVGPYAGFYVGGIINENYSFFVGTPLRDWHMSHFAQGGLVGYNFQVAGPVRVGVEAQAGIHYDTSGDINFEGQALTRLGVVPLDGVLLYAAGGVGTLNGSADYAAGGGIEYALWGGDASVRLEGLALAQNPPRSPRHAGWSASKWTIGTIWHMD